jgi:hypothetical protein
VTNSGLLNWFNPIKDSASQKANPDAVFHFSPAQAGLFFEKSSRKKERGEGVADGTTFAVDTASFVGSAIFVGAAIWLVGLAADGKVLRVQACKNAERLEAPTTEKAVFKKSLRVNPIP